MKAVVLLLAVCALLAVAHAKVQCGHHQACSTCVSDNNCGWCEGECLDGAYDGPYNGDRNCTDWSYGFCAGEPCKMYTSCFTCVSDPYCGWCAGEKACVEGDENGPVQGACGNGWNHDGCTSVDPFEGDDVISMLQVPEEDHAAEAARAQEEAQEEAAEEAAVAQLAAGGSTAEAEEAAALEKKMDYGCDAYANCAECTTNEKCGWCSETQTCSEGFFHGPAAAGSKCNTWDFSFCSAETCYNHKSCSSCLSDFFCGWCDETKTCLEGDKHGALAGACPSWNYGYCKSSDCKPDEHGVRNC